VAVPHHFVSTRTHRLVAASGGAAFAIAVLYGVWAYAGRFGVPADTVADPWASIGVNIALFLAFGLHHSLFARTGLKARLASAIPAQLERTTYVWIASLLFFLLMSLWQPVPGILWHVGTPAIWLFRGVQIAGAVFLLWAGRRMDVADLAGIRKPFQQPLPESSERTELTDRGPYGIVRHPLYLAIVWLLWTVPVMTNTRLLFAVLNTAYLFVAIPLEERDLRRHFGASYDRYATRVRYRLLPGIY
jgi:protein-S-isoprenylcysteine O-methyltransferase Ste14